MLRGPRHLVCDRGDVFHPGAVEDRAGQTYDAFLKQNGQELGLRSYGACVDLLVAWEKSKA